MLKEIDSSISNDRHLIYHSDLIYVNKIRKDLFCNSIMQSNKVYHLILYNDFLLVCSKETMYVNK